jgi:hypothetical protein
MLKDVTNTGTMENIFCDLYVSHPCNLLSTNCFLNSSLPVDLPFTGVV